MKLAQLLSQLNAAGIQPLTLSTSAGGGSGKIIVTPHGGRVLGIFTHDAVPLSS